MAETQPARRYDEVLPHTGTLPLDRAHALSNVLGIHNLPFRVVAREGVKYPDGNAVVPKGEVFVTYATGEIPEEIIWRMVDEIAPLPMVDGKK